MLATLEQSVELATSETGRVDQQLACVDDCKDMSCNQTAISQYVFTSRQDSPRIPKDPWICPFSRLSPVASRHA